MPARAFLVVLWIMLLAGTASSQIIYGEALDLDNKKPIEGVVIDNIYTNVSITTAADGSFVISAASGQLLEFRKPGFKVTRVRIPAGYMPSYFRIIMERGITPPSDIYVSNSNRYDNRRDSIKFRQFFEHQLDFPKMSAMEKIKSPFSALSKRNRMIWQFQEDYSNFEKEKYVDFTFNPKLVTNMTGLTGDSLASYMRRFRPTYEQLQGMNDYTFFTYIKSSVHRYRSFTLPTTAQ
jgi:hypothetical protein